MIILFILLFHNIIYITFSYYLYYSFITFCFFPVVLQRQGAHLQAHGDYGHQGGQEEGRPVRRRVQEELQEDQPAQRPQV